MSLQTHLTELSRRHEAIEREIQNAMAHPAADDLRIAELKRRKLRLKDEMAKIRDFGRAVRH